jgi:hypothetical protein
MVSLCGVSIPAESLRALAGRLEDDPIGEKLERAVDNDNTIVALSFAERQQIVDALAESAPGGLVSVRTELCAQLKRHREHQAKVERTDRYRAIEARRRAATEKPSTVNDTSNGG